MRSPASDASQAAGLVLMTDQLLTTVRRGGMQMSLGVYANESDVFPRPELEAVPCEGCVRPSEKRRSRTSARPIPTKPKVNSANPTHRRCDREATEDEANRNVDAPRSVVRLYNVQQRWSNSRGVMRLRRPTAKKRHATMMKMTSPCHPGCIGCPSAV